MVGDVINDVLVEPAGAVVAGADNAASVRARPGGSAANQAAWMGYLGLDVVFAGRVGRLDAEFHRLELARFGVSARLAVDDSLATGSIVVLVEADGERTMITDRAANLRLVASDVPSALLDEAALLHLTGYTLFEAGTRQVALGLIEEARRRAIPFTVDPGSAAFLARLPPGDFIRWTEGAAVCFPNRDEAATLTAGPDPAAMAASLARCYGVVALKLGPDGGLVATRDSRPLRFPAVASVPRDTTGAGDAFCAGFLAAGLSGAGLSGAGLSGAGLSGAGLTSAALAASRAAAAAVSLLGGRPPVPVAGSPG
ncbi:MAG TPA: PfkB family carbohydrate kinase [Trebonia sp.]|nr:PfkB family carbohydrate kinase [Trebonia sp.]